MMFDSVTPTTPDYSQEAEQAPHKTGAIDICEILFAAPPGSIIIITPDEKESSEEDKIEGVGKRPTEPSLLLEDGSFITMPF